MVVKRRSASAADHRGGFLIGVFHWSNYWDFVIYFVVIAGFSLYGALYRYHARAKETIGTVLLQAAEALQLERLSPFRLQ